MKMKWAKLWTLTDNIAKSTLNGGMKMEFSIIETRYGPALCADIIFIISS